MNSLFGNWRSILVALLVGSLAGLSAGVKLTANHYQAKQAAAIEQAHRVYVAEKARGDKLAAHLLEEQGRKKIVYRTIRQEVDHVANRHACLFDAGFVVLWNDALAGRLSEAAGGTDEAAISAGVVGAREVLGNHVDNAEQCAEQRAQLNALIDFEEGRDAGTAD